MIAAAAVAVSSDDSMTPMQRAAAFMAAAQSAAADGITWQEFGQLLVALMRMLVAAFDQIVTMTGAAKKALVLEAVGQLFDLLADKCVPVIAWPIWALCRSAIRSLVLALASGAIEQLLPLVRAISA